MQSQSTVSVSTDAAKQQTTSLLIQPTALSTIDLSTSRQPFSFITHRGGSSCIAEHVSVLFHQTLHNILPLTHSSRVASAVYLHHRSTSRSALPRPTTLFSTMSNVRAASQPSLSRYLRFPTWAAHNRINIISAFASSIATNVSSGPPIQSCMTYLMLLPAGPQPRLS